MAATALKPVTSMSRASRDPKATGERVLAALDAGRGKINEIRQRQAQATRDIVQALAEDDASKGYPSYGRAGRIVKKLRSKGIGRTTVYRHYSELFCTGQNS